MSSDPLSSGECSGALSWHKDHLTGDLTFVTITGPKGERRQSHETFLKIGNSTTFDVDGLKVTVEYPCAHHFGPWQTEPKSFVRFRVCEVCGTSVVR